MVWIHPSWILLQSHQEDVLLFVGGVQSQDPHHDEVREEEEGQGGQTVKTDIYNDIF